MWTSLACVYVCPLIFHFKREAFDAFKMLTVALLVSGNITSSKGRKKVGMRVEDSVHLNFFSAAGAAAAKETLHR